MNRDTNRKIIVELIEDLTGQNIPLEREIPKAAIDLLTKPKSKGLGYSQFNELLLSLGYDRVSHSFFQFLVNKTTEYKTGASINNLTALRTGIDEFRKVAILFFGNIKFAFKNLSRDTSFLKEHLRRFSQRREKSFQERHDQIMNQNVIAAKDTYLLGYLIKKELEEKLAKAPRDQELRRREARRQAAIKKGKKNHDGYLVSDHLDVYIATSMREAHEFISVHTATRKIFAHKALKKLKLRWFDPTQAFCEDRIDKGLSEGLMLRRAKCTIYFAQESDTFGKDSELASTLAQGKPVIAFVPQPSSTAAEDLINQLADHSDGKTAAILKMLQVYDPSAAWNEPKVRAWIQNPTCMKLHEGIDLLQTKILDRFHRRNKTLREDHPLGIQINLQTGVANGVLVANTVDECARVVRALMLRELEFELIAKTKGNHKYLILREKITKSIFRVVTGDAFLTNAFWNFYLNPIEGTYSTEIEDDEDYKKTTIDPYDLTRTGAAPRLNLIEPPSIRKSENR